MKQTTNVTSLIGCDLQSWFRIGSVTYIDVKSGIGESSSNSGLACRVPFRTNALRKGINLSHFPLGDVVDHIFYEVNRFSSWWMHSHVVD